MTEALDARAASVRPALYTGAVVAVCAIALLGFASNFVILPVLPLLVLERGGDATMVGIVIAAFSFPSVVLRPVVGRLADTAGSRVVLLGGLGIIALAGFAYLVPLLAVVLLVRIVHGTGWAAFSTGGHTLLARLAPAERRAEASGVYNLMPGIAQMALPSVGLLLYAWSGVAAAFIATSLFGLIAIAVVLLGPVPADAPGRVHGEHGSTPRGRDAWLEPGAVRPMGYEFLFSLPYSLFATFPPVFAASKGIPVTELAIYYPVYGLTLVAARAVTGPFLDRAPRARVILLGASLAIVGLGVSVAADTVLLLTVGGAIYGAAAGFTSPVTMAIAIDRAEPRRLGAAMATYTLGFQLAIGVGAALWGVLIDTFGYPSPYLVAIAIQVALLVAVALAGRGAGPANAGLRTT